MRARFNQSEVFPSPSERPLRIRAVILRTLEPYRKRPIVGPTAAATPRKENRSINPPPSYLSTPMPDTEHTDGEKRQESDGTTLTVEEWIELMNKYDRLDQYAKRRKEEQTESGDG